MVRGFGAEVQGFWATALSFGVGLRGFWVGVRGFGFGVRDFGAVVEVLGLGSEGSPLEMKFQSLSKLTLKTGSRRSFQANSDQFGPRSVFLILVGLRFAGFRKDRGNLGACCAEVSFFCDVVRLGFEV